MLLEKLNFLENYSLINRFFTVCLQVGIVIWNYYY